MKQSVTFYRCNIWGYNFHSLGPEANLPTETAEQGPSTVEVNDNLFDQLQEALQEEPKPQQVKVVHVQKADNQSKKKIREKLPKTIFLRSNTKL